MTPRGRAELALASVTVVWGTTFAVVKGALQDVSPLLFITLRFTLAAVILGTIYRSALKRSQLAPGLVCGALLFFAFVFQTLGLSLTTPTKSAFLTSLAIPMVPLAGSLVYRTRTRLLEGLGIAVASLGMVLMTLPQNLFSQNSTPVIEGLNAGDLLSLLCAVLFAAHMVAIGHFTSEGGFESVAVIQVAVVAVLAFVATLFVEPLRFQPTPTVMGAIAITGLLATALAFTTMAWAQQYTTATRTAIIFALEPVVAWLTSWLLAGETMGSRAMAGAALILGGILLVELRPGLKRAGPEGHH